MVALQPRVYFPFFFFFLRRISVTFGTVQSNKPYDLPRKLDAIHAAYPYNCHSRPTHSQGNGDYADLLSASC